MTDLRLLHRFRDTGFPVGEALEKAQRWWGEHRGAIRREFNRVRKEKVTTGVGVPLLRSITEGEGLRDGILSGNRWDDLTRAEQVQIVKVWHHYHIRVPMRGPQKPELTKHLAVLTVTCDNPAHPEFLPATETFEAMTTELTYQMARNEGWGLGDRFDYCPWCNELATVTRKRLPS
ncbi:MAG: hypothetical protein QNJ94_18710 [Alphaproteobacteria bacterium]|nr:hypothetical protein [Alphaproteobacteria bacterium]